MTKNTWILAAGVAATAAGLTAQTAGTAGGSQFQQATVMSDGGPMVVVPLNGWRVATPPGGGRGGPQMVVGKPIAATEERKTVQTLADGTQLENADSNLFYRDSQGRTRVEQTSQGRTRIVITDPVAHTTVVLDPATKTARRNTLPMMNSTIRAVPRKTAPATSTEPAAGVARSGGGGGRVVSDSADGYVAGQFAAMQDLGRGSEELGVQTVNGVAAQGTRVTQVIAAGKIGNNRDLHIFNERWFSSDLQMVVKTVNSDPRFGVTTYQLTNIMQGVQDAGLFQIPSDYTVVEPGQ